MVNEGIDIQNVGSYTFTQFEDYVISPTEDMFENLSVIMTIHHILFPNSDKSFDDNGSGDDFDPPTPDKFWGKTESCFNVTSDVEPTGVKCYVTYHVKKYRFWVKTYDELELGEEVGCNETCETLTQE